MQLFSCGFPVDIQNHSFNAVTIDFTLSSSTQQGTKHTLNNMYDNYYAYYTIQK